MTNTSSVRAPGDPAQGQETRPEWITRHLDAGHTVTKREQYDECSCGATYWRSAAPLGRDAERSGVGPWQPIETAPRDGTEILVYAMNRKERERRFVDVALFDASQTWDGLDLWFTGSGSHPATHWMPLPSPPSQGPKEPSR